MREILFRGKRTDNGEWVEGTFTKYGPTGAELNWIVPKYASYLYAFEIDADTVGQFTGLTDMKGRRIFEGDIVEGGDFNAEDNYGVIFWDAEDACWEICGQEPNNLCADFTQYWGRDVEVIGNVYDNPELLEEATP